MPQPSHDTLLGPCSVRLGDGRVFRGFLPAWRHQRIHLALLHRATVGLVEIAAGPRDGHGKVHINTRKRRDHYFPGGTHPDAAPGWLQPILATVQRHHAAGDEVFTSVAERRSPSALKWHTTATRHLWLDVDDAAALATVRSFLHTPTDRLPRGRRPSLVVHSGRGAHFYFPLSQPLPALVARLADGREIVDPLIASLCDGQPTGFADPTTGELLDSRAVLTEPIERMLIKLAHALGHRIDEDGRQVCTVADEAVAKRSQPMRLAGTINHRAGAFARIVYADLSLPGYDVDALAGDLPDVALRPTRRRVGAVTQAGQPYTGPDPYKQLDLRRVYTDFTGREVPDSGEVRCPSAAHEDKEPSCGVTPRMFNCLSCPAGGDVYHLVSAAIGGPSHGPLHGDAFLAARRALEARYGDLRRGGQARPRRAARRSAPAPASPASPGARTP